MLDPSDHDRRVGGYVYEFMHAILEWLAYT